MNLKEALEGKLTKEEMQFVPRAYDVVGEIAIIQVPPEISKKKKVIAKALQDTQSHIKTIYNKVGERSGDYRLSKLERIAGTGSETVHTEYGCKFVVDVKKAYFSGREGSERQRIAAQVKPKENVLVMFSGVCPSPVTIAKKQPLVEKVYGIDINPDAYKYAQDNIRINRVQTKVNAYCGDVRKAAPELGLLFDRIIMPLPKGAHEFLDVAFQLIKKNGTIHFYHWDREDDLYSGAIKLIESQAKKSKKKIKIISKKKVLPYGPRIWKICMDFKVM